MGPADLAVRGPGIGGKAFADDDRAKEHDLMGKILGKLTKNGR